jgi:hypothetical protein
VVGGQAGDALVGKRLGDEDPHAEVEAGVASASVGAMPWAAAIVR